MRKTFESNASFVPVAAAVSVASLLLLLRPGPGGLTGYLLSLVVYVGFLLWAKAPLKVALVLLALANAASASWMLCNTSSMRPEVLEAFIIGDSDSAVYDAAARSIADHVDVGRQLKVWDIDYVRLAEYEGGYQFKDVGFVWLLGVIYTLVGPQNGALFLALVTPLILSMAVTIGLWQFFSWDRFEIEYSNIRIVILCLILLFGNLYVLQAIVSCRKDNILVLLFISSIAFFSKRRYLIASILAIAACTFRSGLILAYCASFVLWIGASRLTSSRLVIAFAILLMIAPPALQLASPYLSFFSQDQISGEVVEALRSELRGSAIFIEKWWLRAAYVLFSPFPALSIASYTQGLDSLLNALASFANLVLLVATIYYSYDRKNQRSRVWHLLMCVIVSQYMALIWNLNQAAMWGMYGILEPRYKLTIWVTQLCIVLHAFAGNTRFQPIPNQVGVGANPNTGARGKPWKFAR